MRFFKYSDVPGEKKETTVEKTVRETKGFSSFFAKIVCIIAAIMVWFYVSGEQSITFEKEFTGVQIKYEMGALTEKGYTVINGKNATVNVTLSGTRRDVNSIKNEDIIARVDLSNVNTSGEYPVDIYVSAPGNTVVKNTYPSELKLYIDKTTKKSFKIEPEAHNISMGDSSLKIRRYDLTVNEVWVTGPAEELDKIAGAKIDLDFYGEKLTSNVIKSNVTIKLVGDDGKVYSNPYVIMDELKTDVEVVVNKYVTVPIKAKYSGKFNIKDSGYSETIEPKELTIRGTPEIIDGISYIETNEINSDEISGAIYDVTTGITLPGGVETEGTAPKTAKVTLERVNGTGKITTDNIIFINSPAGYEVSLADKEITVTFSGNLEDIEKLNGNNVYLIADLSGITKAGEYTGIRLRVVSYGLDVIENGSVKVDGQYTCTLNVAKN
ncbi:MAG: hypothetical protein IKI97_01490 [Clostridia bacterium]|nr:hypothetical protein [Clostridia bacterium]